MIIETTQIEVVQPAKIVVPMSVKNIAVLNHNIIDNHNVFESDLHRYLFQFDSISSQKMVDFVAEEITHSPRYDSIIRVEPLFLRTHENYANKSSWSFVETQCNKYGTDGLLVLEGLGINDTLINLVYNDGYSSVNYSMLAFIVNSFWCFYIPSNKTVNEQIVSDTIYLDEIENYKHLKHLLARSDGRYWLANKVAKAQVSSISDEIAPYWVRVDRTYLRKGNTDLKLAGKYAATDQWLKAAEIWKKYTQSKQPYIAAASCYNMALVCEIQGKLPLAISWVEQSLKHKETSIALEYKTILKKRLTEVQELNNQFGITE